MKCDECKKELNKNTRTLDQNRALHLYFTLIADALNESGQDMRKFIRQEVDIPWSSESVKEYIWRPIQKIYLNKISTTQLTTKDITPIYDIVNRIISERAKIHVPFPDKKQCIKY